MQIRLGWNLIGLNCRENGRIDVTLTYKEYPGAVSNAFHHELVVLKVIVAYVQHLVCVDIRYEEHDYEEAYYDKHAFKLQNPSGQATEKAKHLAVPEDKVKCFRLKAEYPS